MLNSPALKYQFKKKLLRYSDEQKELNDFSWIGIISALTFGAIIAAAILWSDFAHAQAPVNDLRAIKAIIGEAENQGYAGMVYVACAIRNRGTLQGVYGERAPRVLKHKYSDQIALQAQSAWAISELPDTCIDLKGATHWENIKAFGCPKWVKDCIETLRYKDHVFYREIL